MPVQANQIVRVNLPPETVRGSIEIARRIASSIVDRPDLHGRDALERFIDCLMGELAEQMVITWLTTEGKHAVSAVDKTAASPDPGHDIWLKDAHGAQIRASIKSSLSATKTDPAEILSTFTLATNPRELRDVNIQVYFWLNISNPPRVTVPSLQNAALFAWASASDLGTGEFAAYRGEHRAAPSTRLIALQPMSELLVTLT